MAVCPPKTLGTQERMGSEPEQPGPLLRILYSPSKTFHNTGEMLTCQ